jgi:hypothetical protein
MTKPVRLQFSRRRGFDLRALSLAVDGLPAVNVARPSLFGNPCRYSRSYGCPSSPGHQHPRRLRHRLCGAGDFPSDLGGREWRTRDGKQWAAIATPPCLDGAAVMVCRRA